MTTIVSGATTVNPPTTNDFRPNASKPCFPAADLRLVATATNGPFVEGSHFNESKYSGKV